LEAWEGGFLLEARVAALLSQQLACHMIHSEEPGWMERHKTCTHASGDTFSEIIVCNWFCVLLSLQLVERFDLRKPL
jgi:hypothetical protein